MSELGSTTTIQALLVAALVGLLVGLERERKRDPGGSIFAGIRTFPLIAVFGAVTGMLTELYGPLALLAGTLAIATLVGLSYWRVSQGPKVGGTTEAAVLVVFGLGALTGHGEWLGGLAGAVIATGLLSLRAELHDFAGGLDRGDLFAVVQFAVITLVVLPLLPDARFGPWEVWNPRQLWLLVVLISGTSFLGYAAGKLVGPGRGAVLGGALGGFASSTAVTAAHAQRTRSQPALARSLAVGALAANAVMGPRALVVLWVVSPALAWRLLPPAAALVLVIGLTVALLRRVGGGTGSRGAVDAVGREEETSSTPGIRNPAELRSALLFGALFAAFLLLVEAAREFLGSGALVVTAALAGSSHLDAATLSVAQQLERGLDPGVAGVAVTLALVANVLVKALLALVSRDRTFVVATTIPLLVGAAAALATLALPPLPLS